jgi:hypothetical protein
MTGLFIDILGEPFDLVGQGSIASVRLAPSMTSDAAPKPDLRLKIVARAGTAGDGSGLVLAMKTRPPALRGPGAGRRGWKTFLPSVTIGAMSSIRFLLILLLTIALDLSTPLPPQHGTEATEEFEESLHARRGRRAFRHVRETVVPAVAQEERAHERLRPRLLAPAPARPAVTTVLIRKLPPSVAEPSSAPEDH